MFYKNNMNLIFILFISLCIPGVFNYEFKYHTNQELEVFLKNFADSTKFLSTKLYSIGKTGHGFELWAMEVTAVRKQIPGIPNIKLIGNIHGNEVVGRQILLYFLEYLRDNYNKTEKITWLLDNTRIHILPSLNPDGFNISEMGSCVGQQGRGNKWRVDLNRSFPDKYYKNPWEPQVETKAVMQWMKNIPFTLSACLHGGALVANYPFDTVKNKDSGVKKPSYTPDNDVFFHLATVYSETHRTMHNNVDCLSFGCHRGTINGALWYDFTGGMQDYNYFAEGCMEITLEISTCKYPKADELEKFWNENRNALVEYCSQAHIGVTGQILDSDNKIPIVGATLQITGRDQTFTSKENGQFWRILLPGIYWLEVSNDGYHNTKVQFEVLNIGYTGSYPKLTYLEVFLLNSSYHTTTKEPLTTITSIEKRTTAQTSTERVEISNDPTARTSELKNISCGLGTINLLYRIILIFVIFLR